LISRGFAGSDGAVAGADVVFTSADTGGFTGGVSGAAGVATGAPSVNVTGEPSTLTAWNKRL
jgi:hypothetical protein